MFWEGEVSPARIQTDGRVPGGEVGRGDGGEVVVD